MYLRAVTKTPTIAALWRLAQAAGYTKVTERTIREWRRRGLLPSRKSEGARRGDLPCALRPEEQLLALCRIRYERHVRHLHDIAFWLWWERFEAPADEVLHVFEEAAVSLDLFVARASSPQGSGFAEEKLEEQRFYGMRLFTQARTLVGKEHFAEFLEATATGMVQGGLSEAQTDLVETGLAFPTSWAIPEDLIGQLLEVGPAVFQCSFVEEMREAQASDLAPTRDALSALWRRVQAAWPPIGDALGPGTLVYIARDLGLVSAPEVAEFILLWPRLRALVRPAGIDMDAMFEALAGLIAGQLQVFVVCWTEIEALRDLLCRRNVRRALKDDAYGQRLFGLAQDTIGANGEALSKLLALNKELQAVGLQNEEARVAWQRVNADLARLKPGPEHVN
jgi:hypothetical protein